MSDPRLDTALPEWPVFVGVTIDAVNPQRIASYWADLLDVTIEEIHEEEIRLARQPHRGVGVAVQRVADPTPGKNRIHLDMLVRDVGQATARAVALGGRALDEHCRDGYSWRIVADPEGNQFCLVQPPVE
ncbi:MAG: VOC family protein [Dactylosporangium sp.]|nr:hypothetical protein [Dactylosporangium sp.]NNJ61172.1 VOC family protein [Dactylosporangium sp.]